MFGKIKRHKIKIFSTLFLGLLLGCYIYNVLNYNSYWAYDGGAHIDYIFTLAETNKLPLEENNYLAWHEPLYYIFNAVLIKPFLVLGVENRIILKILQVESVVLAMLFVIGAGILAWLLSKNKAVSLVVLVLTGSLYVVSSLAKYISNEIFFHTLIIWWLILFFYWGMENFKRWTYKKWLILILGLVILLWIKLTALILILAVFLWLLFIALKNKNIFPIILSLIIFVVLVASYSPWLFYKYENYGSFLTINNYENLHYKNESKMPVKFYFDLNKAIFQYPFWNAGQNSFWTMFYASTLVDFDSVFQYHQDEINVENFRVINMRYIPVEYAQRALVVIWASLPLLVILIFGFLLFFVFEFKKRIDGNLFLTILIFGFLMALIYNTYNYPFLERGTMKTIFIVSFFPLFFLFSIVGLEKFVDKIKGGKFLSVAFVIYLLFWVGLNLWNIVLIK